MQLTPTNAGGSTDPGPETETEVSFQGTPYAQYDRPRKGNQSTKMAETEQSKVQGCGHNEQL